MISLPLSKGFLYWGIPSFNTTFTSPRLWSEHEWVVWWLVLHRQHNSCTWYTTCLCAQQREPDAYTNSCSGTQGRLVPRLWWRRETTWYGLFTHAWLFPENLGIHLHLEIVCEINMYTSDIFCINERCTYNYLWISCSLINPHRQAEWTLQSYGNIVEMAAHVQTVDTRLFLSSHMAWVWGNQGRVPALSLSLHFVIFPALLHELERIKN